MSTNVFLRLWAPAGTVCVNVAPSATLRDVYLGISQAVGAAPTLTRGGHAIDLNGNISNNDELDVSFAVRGGKGGFGQNLRAEGGRISKKLDNMSKDDCRDLHGRRISTVKEAQRLAEWLAKEPERRKALDDAQKKKYARLERLLGREPRSTADFEEVAAKLADGDTLDEFDADTTPGESSKSVALSSGSSVPQPTLTKRKDQIDDAYVEQSRENVERVRGAVAAAMKKRKKTVRAAASAAS
ncbi:hypothetical protein MCUN1_003630 [Malassezia cuniculi]|uniref:SDE2-like domain-containing protein n=1 Tax=Malassezia cuniculi TaxID=948313 RepID=A0AAF0F1Y0_9BASI|nr:hypothetical protein MCUN1_003630 [Malassezia cuniculi]